MEQYDTLHARFNTRAKVKGNTRNPMITYHQNTAHARGAITGRALNWDDRPVPFKSYKHVPVFHLTHELVLPDTPLDVALQRHAMADGQGMPAVVAGICNLAAGISQVRKQSDGTAIHFRTTASAGGLYPAELYLVLQNVSGIDDGLYHYSALEHVLHQLRAGKVYAQDGSEPVIRFYLSAIFHRSGWKYGARAYRYCLLDAGHMAENLLLAARIHGLPAQVDYDFNDAAVNRFLGIDSGLEGCLAQVHGLGCETITGMNDEVSLITEGLAAFSRCARRNGVPEALLVVHGVSSSFARCPLRKQEIPPAEATPLPDPVFQASTSATIMGRRSRRNFVPSLAPTREIVEIISLLCRDIAPTCADAIEVGFLASAQSGLTPGYYRINRANCSTTLVEAGDFMSQAARACLDQSWIENAALHIVFTADLEGLARECGPRAYRYAHLEAGRLGEYVYLAATAKRLGACGIGAFFDQEAATLLSLPQGHVLVYLVAVGPVR